MQHSSCTHIYSSWYNIHLTSVPCVHPWTFVSSDFICVHYTHPFYGCIPEHLWAQPLARWVVNRIFNMSLTISCTWHNSGFIKSQNCPKLGLSFPYWPLVYLLPLFHSSIVWRTGSSKELHLVYLLPLFHSSIVWRMGSWKELHFAVMKYAIIMGQFSKHFRIIIHVSSLGTQYLCQVEVHIPNSVLHTHQQLTSRLH
jgi:hypothetical protein